MIWQLQLNCLRYCSFVHLHHNAEDADFFSELRNTNPAINPVIDRLQAEHRRVSESLDAVETAAGARERDDSREARQAVVDTLESLRCTSSRMRSSLSVAGTSEIPNLKGVSAPPTLASGRNDRSSYCSGELVETLRDPRPEVV
jgi:hypothetical protein